MYTCTVHPSIDRHISPIMYPSIHTHILVPVPVINNIVTLVVTSSAAAVSAVQYSYKRTESVGCLLQYLFSPDP